MKHVQLHELHTSWFGLLHGNAHRSDFLYQLLPIHMSPGGQQQSQQLSRLFGCRHAAFNLPAPERNTECIYRQTQVILRHGGWGGDLISNPQKRSAVWLQCVICLATISWLQLVL